jgi:hypothetical protein
MELKRFAISLLKQQTDKESIATRRRMAGWSTAYLSKVAGLSRSSCAFVLRQAWPGLEAAGDLIRSVRIKRLSGTKAKERSGGIPREDGSNERFVPKDGRQVDQRADARHGVDWMAGDGGSERQCGMGFGRRTGLAGGRRFFSAMVI